MYSSAQPSSAQSSQDKSLSFKSSKSSPNFMDAIAPDDCMIRRISFDEISKAKIQLTWKNITISSIPKKRWWRRNQNYEPLVILGKIKESLSRWCKRNCEARWISFNNWSNWYDFKNNSLGAGKTTLLNYLSGKDPSKNLKKTGEVLINGVDRNKVDFKSFIGYVQQDDVLIQTMTV